MSQRIRAPFSYRVGLLVIVMAVAVLIWALVSREKEKPWKTYQTRYYQQYLDMARQKVQAARNEKNPEAIRKWESVYADASGFREPELKSIFLPDAGVRDLCPTCHLGIENPLFDGFENPLKSHPKDILADHPPSKFGCTLCHQGQGMALTEKKAHGFEANWPYPRIPRKYVQGLCYGCHASAYGLNGAEIAEKGRRLFVKHGCYACHRVRNMDYLSPLSTPLTDIGAKIKNFSWVYQWLKNPVALRPNALMPTFKLKPQEISHITAFLANAQREGLAWETFSPGQGNRKNGEALFTEKGCIACHSVDYDLPGASQKVPGLSDAGFKLQPRWIMTWLKNPSVWDPQTPMPQLTLTADECKDLSEYILSLQHPAVSEKLAGVQESLWQSGQTAEGRRLVQSYGCYGCHPIEEMNSLPPVGDDVANMAGKRLEELPFGNSSIPRTKWDWLFHKIKKPDIYELPTMPLKMPDYTHLKGFSDGEIIALTTFYLHNTTYSLPEKYLCQRVPEQALDEKGQWLVDQFNCRGCHLFSETEKPRIENFMALKSLVPPRLVDEGERVQPQWLFQFLSRPVELRPWLKMRMPNFNWSYPDKTDLISYFSRQNRVDAAKNENEVLIPYVRLPVKADYDPEIIAMGEYRVTTDKCVQCHPVSMDMELPKDVKLEDLSINLMLSKSRLRYEWIKKFLRNPDKYAGKGTKMPFVYYTPDGAPRISDPETWIEYSALYLMFMEKLPEPPKETKIEDIRPGSDIDWTSY